MSDDKRTEDSLKELIVDKLFLSVDPADIGDEDVLVEKFEVDSVRMLDIVMGLEEVFEISFEDDDFSMERFESVKAIAAVVREKLGQAEP